MLIPSTLDPTLAPAGKHVASLFVQHVAPQLPAGRSWEDAREKEAFADLVIETVTRHAPNFKEAVIARQILSPLDIEKRFGMVDGDIFHGALSLDQLFSARPLLGYAALPHAGAGPLPVRGGRPSRRRRDGRAGAQRGARDHRRPQGLARRPTGSRPDMQGHRGDLDRRARAGGAVRARVRPRRPERQQGVDGGGAALRRPRLAVAA